MAMSKEVDLAHAQRPVPCDTCEDEVPGTYYCIQCKKTLCEDCEKSHEKFTKDHKVILRTQMGEIDSSILTCSDHKCEVSFHCEKCNVPVCPECVTGKHQGHKMASLKNIIEKKKELLQGNINKIKNVIIPKLEKQREETKSEREIYKKNIEQIKTEMGRENQTLHDELNRVHQKRLKSLNSTQQNNLTLIDNHTEDIQTKLMHYKGRATELEDALAKENVTAIFRFVERSEAPLQIKSKPYLLPSPSFTPGDVKKITELLGKIQDSSSLKDLKLTTPTVTSKFKCPLKGFPRICITKEGDIWLGAHKTRMLAQVNMHGEILKTRNIRYEPYMLAVMDCGEFIMTPQGNSSVPVIRLKSDGTEQIMFEIPLYNCLGISVTQENNILLCLENGSVVLTNDVGTCSKHIYNDSGEESALRAIESTDGNIYISSWSKHAVVVASKEGKILSSITNTVAGEKLERPLGFALDRLGNILCADFARHCVYIIDQYGQASELIGPSFGIKKPRDLAIDNNNNLWITHSEGNIFVFKYLS